MTLDPQTHKHGIGDMIWDKDEDGVCRYAVCRSCEAQWKLLDSGWKPLHGTVPLAPQYRRPSKKKKKRA